MNKKFGINPISPDFSVFLNESHDYLKTIENLKNINLSKEHLSLYISFMQSAPISIVFINEQEQILFTNKNFEYRARKGQTEILGQPISDIFPINLNKNDREEIFFQTITKGEWSGNLTYLDKKEHQKKIWLRINQFKLKDGDTIFGIQFFDSGTRNFRAFSENTLSYLDPQTNLPNFNQFAFDINQAIWRKETKLAGLALIRCQNASEISMHHSRQTQKLVMNEMIKRIHESLPKYFYLYRLSREVFALYSSDYEKEDEFKTLVSQIRTKLLAPLVIEEHSIFLNIEIGGAFYPSQVNHLASLLQSTEICLNQRNTSKIIYFSEGMNQKYISNLKIIEKLESACNQKSLQLKYQPIMNLAGTIKAAEALLDWQDEELGNISPKQILAATHEYGHTYKLNQWLLNQLAKEPLFKQVNIIIKIEASQLMDRSFFSEVLQHVKNQSLIPNHICFEVTELHKIQNIGLVIRKLKRLRALGFGIAMNDFSIGYSNFDLLINLPVDILKINAAFIAGLEKNSRKEIVLRHVIQLAQELDLLTCCEGITTDEELNIATTLGSDCLQGPYFSEALTVADFIHHYC